MKDIENLRFKKPVAFVLAVVCLIITIQYCLSSYTDVYIKPQLTSVDVQDSIIHLGLLEKDHPTEAIFKLNNYGESPLIIQNVETSCGCTIPQWTAKPIKMGQTGEVKVVFDAKYPGRFYKTITVYANIPDSPIQLNIDGEVEYKKVSDIKN